MSHIHEKRRKHRKRERRWSTTTVNGHILLLLDEYLGINCHMYIDGQKISLPENWRIMAMGSKLDIETMRIFWTAIYRELPQRRDNPGAPREYLLRLFPKHKALIEKTVLAIATEKLENPDFAASYFSVPEPP